MAEKYRVCFTRTKEKPTGDNDIYKVGNNYYKVYIKSRVLFEKLNSVSLVEELIKRCRSPRKVSLEITVKE